MLRGTFKISDACSPTKGAGSEPDRDAKAPPSLGDHNLKLLTEVERASRFDVNYGTVKEVTSADSLAAQQLNAVFELILSVRSAIADLFNGRLDLRQDTKKA